jgi:membrane fusion protein, adhesin transport system
MNPKYKGLWKYALQQEWPALKRIFLLSIFISVFQLSLPLGIQSLTIFISGGEFTFGVISIVIIVIIATLLANRWQIALLKEGQDIELRWFEKLSLAYFQKWSQQKDAADQVIYQEKSKYFIEISSIQKGFSKHLLEWMGAALQLVLGLVLISFYHTFFLIFGVLLLATLIFLIRIKGRASILSKMELSDAKYGMYGYLQDGSLNSEEINQKNKEYKESKETHFHTVLFQVQYFLIIKIAVIAGMLVLGTWLAIEQQISIGQFLAAEIVIVLIVNSLEKIITSIASVYENIVAFEKALSLFHKEFMLSQIDQEKDSPWLIKKENTFWNKQKKLTAALLIFIGILFLPWTQNIEAEGKVISLSPNERPQSVQSIIAGRIEKWYVQEGDSVKAGDTLLFISEIKDEYFDPQLLANTESQLVSKENAVNSYMEKVQALDHQIDALITAKEIKRQQTKTKIDQARLKVKTDSVEYLAVEKNAKIIEEQLNRYQSLLEQNVISRTEWETRQMAYQNAQAKKNDQYNKLNIARAEWENAVREYRGIDAEYRDKIAKAESDKHSTFSAMYDTEAQVTKLQNQYNNYDKRSGLYYIIAPQNGFVSKVTKSGIGETIKEGEEVVRISPQNFKTAVELWISPVNNPLVHEGENVRIIFDGWPAFVVSGWSQMSTGLFDGTIISVDPAIQENGKFRIWVTPIEGSNWPNQLRMGGGAKGILLLNDVPLVYELWRILNGFSPDFYTPEKKTLETTKK